jgi:hypothetical protein
LLKRAIWQFAHYILLMEEVTTMSRATCKLLTACALALLLSIPAASATWEPMGYLYGGIAFQVEGGELDFSNFSCLRFQYERADPDYNPALLDVFPEFGLFNLAGTVTPNTLFAEYSRQANTAKWKMLLDGDEEVVSGAGLTVLWYNFQVVDDLYYRLDFDAILTADYIAGLDGNFPYPYTGRFLVQWKGLELTGKADDGWYFFEGGAKIHAEVIPDASTVTLFASGLLPMAALLRRRKA